MRMKQRQGMMAAAAGVALLAGLAAGQTTYTWSGGGADGNWGTSGNWDTAPVSGATTLLSFGGNANGFVSVNNLAANPFNLMGLTFGAGLVTPFTVSSANPLRFDFSASRLITHSSANKVTIAAPIQFSATNRDLKFIGTGAGDIEVTGVYSFPHQSTMTVDATALANVILNQVDLSTRTSYFYNNMPVATGKELRFNGPIRFIAVSDPTIVYMQGAGRTIINGQLQHVGAAGGSFLFGPASGGTLLLNNAAGVFATPISGTFGVSGQVVGTIDLRGYIHDNVVNLTYTGNTYPAASNGILRLRGNFFLDAGFVDIEVQDSPGFSANLIMIEGNNSDAWINKPFTHSGVTRLIASDITLQNNGAVNQSSIEFDVVPTNGEDSRLILSNTAVNQNDRVSDTKSVTMVGGQIVLIGNASAATQEGMGPVTVSRQAAFLVDAAAGGVSSLTGVSLTRSNYGTLYVGGDNLGAVAGANVGQVKFTAAPATSGGALGTTSAPVVPWVTGYSTYNSGVSANWYADMLTYDSATGFRRLAVGEYVQNNPAAGGGANNRITTSQNLAGADVAMKSLTIIPAANGNYTLGGTGAERLTVTDGVIVSGRSNQGPANFITVPFLTFGPNPVTGYEGVIHSYSGQGFTIDSAIVNNGVNAVSLTKAGPQGLILRGANVIGGALRINDGTVTVDGNSSTTVRDIVIDGTVAGSLTINAGSSVTTTGGGTVLYVRRPRDQTALSGAVTLHLSGDVVIDHSHPGGASQTTFGGNLNLGAANRTFTVGNGISNPDLIVSGAIGGSGGLTKAGAGQMRLSGANTYGGPTRVAAGQLQIQGASGALANSPSLSFAAGGSLTLDNSGSGNNNNDRIGDSAPISLAGGSTILKMIGNASAATTEAVGALSFTGQNMISIDAAAGGVSRITAPSLTRVGKGILVFSGDSPGAAEAANVSQIRLTTPPPLVGSGTGIYTPIYPFGIGSGRVDDWGSRWTGPDGGGFLTYDVVTDSLRILSRTTEYTNSWTGADNANVYIGGGSVNLTANRTIQSFMLNDLMGAANINGNAGVQLTISSGLSYGHFYSMLTYNVPYLTFGNPTTGYEGILYNFATDTTSGQGTTVNSIIRDNGVNPVALTIAGLGPTYLGGANTYSGPTTVAGGRLILTTGDNRLPVGTAVDVHTGARLDLNGRSQAVAGLAGSGLVTNGAAGVATLTVNAATDQVFEGSLAGALNLVKNGAATLALTNAAVNCGGSLTVNEGTVYLGAATFSNITVKSGATLRCLSGSRINAANATFESGDTLYVALAGTNATDCTQFVVSGELTFASGAWLGVTTDPGVTPARKMAWQLAQAQTTGTLPRVLGGEYQVSAEGANPVRLVLTYGSLPGGTILLLR